MTEHRANAFAIERQQAIERYPAHDFREGELAGWSGEIPNALVAVPPMPEDHPAQRRQPALGDRIDLVAVDQKGIGGKSDLAINVELLLRSGGIADSDRL